MSAPINFPLLWKLSADQFRLDHFTVHGPDHWRRVERNGLVLAKRTGADIEVVRLFAVFHDSCREDDGWDAQHGARAAEYAAQLRPLKLPGIVLFGDDMQGFCYGFDLSEGGRAVEMDPKGDVDRTIERNFRTFLGSFLG